MLKREDNDLLTRTGPGTPMGNLYRRFWLPVLSSREIAEPEGAPRRLRVLGENLIAFRDTDGAVGILDAYCPHRRSLLFWGRNEENGLRCAYHGWKFATSGRCLDVPCEPPDSNFISKIKIKTYPVAERGGLIWVYMGPGDPPEFPLYDWVDLPESHVVTGTNLQESNYLQALEGDVDTAHVSFLHRWLDPDSAADPKQFVPGYRHYVIKDTAPRLTVKQTDYGFVYGGRRQLDDGQYYWRVTQWIAPSATLIPGTGLRSGRIVVPIDDHYTVAAFVLWHPDRPLRDDEVQGRLRNPTPDLQPVRLDDGYTIDTWRGDLSKFNDYRIDREYQKSTKFSGIRGGPPDEDRAVTETMEPVLDRSKEHLGTSDVAVIALRRALLRMVRDLENGIEPELPRNGALFAPRSWDVISAHDDFNRVLEEWQHELQGGRPAAEVG